MRAPVRIALLAATLTLAACGTSTVAPQAGPGPASPTSSVAGAPSTTSGQPAPGTTSGSVAAAPLAGAYLSAQEYEAQKASRAGTRVVLFFHAPWCSSCRATERALAQSGVPAGLTLVKVDYDTAQSLRQQYGVTVQHTYVQVAPDGSALTKFAGAISGADILAETV